MKVFILHHTHTFDDDENVKLIGVYSSQASAIAAIERLKKKPGFSDTPDGFEIDEYRLDVDHWGEGYVTTGLT